jgi:hypothetical protein
MKHRGQRPPEEGPAETSPSTGHLCVSPDSMALNTSSEAQCHLAYWVKLITRRPARDHARAMRAMEEANSKAEGTETILVG